MTQSIGDAATRKRECCSLAEAMAEYEVDHATVIVEEGEDEVIETDSGIITCIPAWRWFLR